MAPGVLSYLPFVDAAKLERGPPRMPPSDHHYAEEMVTPSTSINYQFPFLMGRCFQFTICNAGRIASTEHLAASVSRSAETAKQS